MHYQTGSHTKAPWEKNLIYIFSHHCIYFFGNNSFPLFSDIVSNLYRVPNLPHQIEIEKNRTLFQDPLASCNVLFFFLFWPHKAASWILVSRPGVELAAS